MAVCFVSGSVEEESRPTLSSYEEKLYEKARENIVELGCP